jgi:cell division protein FtsZ
MFEPITYGDLERLLTHVGFHTRHIVGRHALFVHATSETAVVLPLRNAADPVDPRHIDAVRRTLADFDILNADAFGNALESLRTKQQRSAWAGTNRAATDQRLLRPTDHRGSRVRIKAVGVGYGGAQAVKRMIESGAEGVEFLAVDTDMRALRDSGIPLRVPIGEKLTRGLGAGGNVIIGQKAAEETVDALYDALKDTQIVFILAGLGGGVGSGATPVVASVARELGAVAVGVVTTPFTFEGGHRRKVAEQGLRQLAPVANAVVKISNDRVLHTFTRNPAMADAFRVADVVVGETVRAITNLVADPRSVDVAETVQILADAGSAQVAFGHSTGTTHLGDAVSMALTSPLLERPLDGAKSILCSIHSSAAPSAQELEAVATAVAQAAHPSARVVSGVRIDPSMRDEVKLALIAGGFDAV